MPNFYRQKEEQETAHFNHRQDEAGFFKTQNRKEEDPAYEAAKITSKKVRSVNQTSRVPQALLSRRGPQMDPGGQRKLESN